MFERFSNGARLVVPRAMEEARQLGHRYIGTEHLLLALLDDDAGGSATVLREAGLTRQRVRDDIVRLVQTNPGGQLGDDDAEALRAIGIDLPAVRAKIEEAFGPGALDAVSEPPRRRGLRRHAPSGVASSGHMPFTGRAKKVLELSLRECIQQGHREIRSEHLLLGLLREGEGLAAKVLVDSGVNLVALRQRTLAALAGKAA